MLALGLSALGSVLGPPASDEVRDAALLRIEGRGWALEVRPPEVELGEPQTGAGGVRWVAGDGLEPGLSLTVVLAPVPAAASADDCRTALGARSGARERRGLRRGDHAGMPTLEYDVPRLGGIRLDQRHLHAFLFRDDVCAEIHLAKTDFRGRDRRLFERALDGITFVDDEVPASGR